MSMRCNIALMHDLVAARMMVRMSEGAAVHKDRKIAMIADKKIWTISPAPGDQGPGSSPGLLNKNVCADGLSAQHALQ